MNNSNEFISQNRGSALVVGAGIGGMQASLDLAEAGYKVHLLQQESAIGGTMAMLDKTFPTGDCAMCMLSPRMVEIARHPNINLYTLAEVIEVEGQAGDFTVTVRERPRYVDPIKCTGCGICETRCPKLVEDEFEQNLGKRKAIFSLMAQAVPSTKIIDPDHCLYFQRGRCRVCEKFCETGAINFEDQEKKYQLKVGAIILSPGLSRYDPVVRQELGYGRWPNVITSLQFERILSASGPFLGKIIRPGDEKHPKKIAWIQCVGSRDPHKANPWCSSVCCMYAAKQAVIAKEHDPNIEAVIFYIDLRTYGKDFDKYIDQAINQHGLRFQRAMISQVQEEARTGNLVLGYADEQGILIEETFDLVVLSLGLQPQANSHKFAETFGIQHDSYGFAQTSLYQPIETTRKGIYVAGTYQGPKDIPETVVQGSAAAGKVMALLAKSRGTEVELKELPPERDISKEDPRIGVFVCHCGVNISQTVDVQRVVDSVKDLPQVVHAEDMLYSCSQDSQQRIKELVQEKNLNRVLVASCTPRTHEALFQETIRDAGLNKYLFELADIREQCSWCHMGENELATQKAISIVKMHIAKVRKLQAVENSSVQVCQRALILGGGIAGLTAALSLADQGFEVELVEQQEKLGGLLKNVHQVLGGPKVQDFLQDQIQKVQNNKLIKVHLSAEVIKTRGFVGNFTTTLNTGKKFDHGIIIIAIGGTEYQPQEYSYPDSDRIMTQQELENKILTDPPQNGEHFAMIQCVGSREEPHNYCSRVCCQQAIKNALAIKENCPKAKVTIFYRDIRTYGLREDYYRQARDLGVLFIQFDPDRKPEINLNQDNFEIKAFDPILGRKISIPTDYLVLSTGLRPHPTAQKIAEMYKLSRNEDGYFLEAHVKLRPVDFASEGLFLAGLAHSPKNLDETISQALAAAGRAGTLLSKQKLEVSGIIAKQDQDLCMSCLSCFRICPFGSPYIDEDGRVRHNEVKCMGCGLCAGICPSKAYQVNKFRHDQVLAMIDSAF